MDNTIVITSIYEEFWGTEQFRKSCDRLGLPVYNVWKGKGFTGHASTLRYDYEAFLHLKNQYNYVIYADGADSIFLKSFTPPPNIILYSTEKCVWPNLPDLQKKWDNYHNSVWGMTDWRYINGGGWCGPISLLIQWYEEYLLPMAKGNINGQYEQAIAFLNARKDGFPIELDYQCKYFQTTGFEDPGDFEIRIKREQKVWPKMINGLPKLINLKTGTEPCVLHGNGRTNMDWIYETFK